MTNDSIPNLGAFDDDSLDKAFAAIARQAAENAAGLDGPDAVEAFPPGMAGAQAGSPE